MRRLIIQTKLFSNDVDTLIAANKLLIADYEELERMLLHEPEKGDLIKGTEKSSRSSSKKLKNRKTMKTVSQKTREGLEEILEYKQKKRTLRTKLIDLPEPPFEYKADEIRQIREKGDYSQGVFAIILNVSKKTVQSWESGTRSPSHSALRLLEIIDKGIYCPNTFRHH